MFSSGMSCILERRKDHEKLFLTIHEQTSSNFWVNKWCRLHFLPAGDSKVREKLKLNYFLKFSRNWNDVVSAFSDKNMTKRGWRPGHKEENRMVKPEKTLPYEEKHQTVATYEAIKLDEIRLPKWHKFDLTSMSSPSEMKET